MAADLLAPWTYYKRPFRIYGNLYFVGFQPASTHIIDTGEGLVIIDPGYQEFLYMVLENIRILGFDPKDIRYIVHSHAHLDHAGATFALKQLTGAKTYMGENDCSIANGKHPTLSGVGNRHYNHFEPDQHIHDGDHIRLGNLDMECVETPGHTLGTISFFWNIPQNGRTLRAGMMGGAGFNTLTSKYIHEHQLEAEDRRGLYQKSILRCRQEHVDIFVGNHTGQNDTFGKQERMEAGDTEAFLHSEDWPNFLTSLQKHLDEINVSDPL
ncbi:MAG: MBL fold metallo-hydrolase [Lentisphaeria bacterium]|nr:MBL fold metallo-hydrolase [Lentisphaeria bacterium]